ncbi:MAG: hypothetical protein WEA58_02170 [Balneolaceae bacterium]
MNFILFNLLLLFAGFVAVFIFSITLVIIMSPLFLVSDSEDPAKILMYPLIGIGGIYQVYFWALWASYCVAITYKFTTDPATWSWLYFICGFLWCVSLIGWLSSKEQQGAKSLSEVKSIQGGSTFYSIIAVAAFIVFALWPSLMEMPFGWALNLLV